MGVVLVVGRRGQLATALQEEPPAGREIVALGRDQLDLTDASSVRQALAALNPIGVVNAAAYTAVDRAETEPDAAFALNRDGPEILARACAEHGAPLVHLSTDYVFDGAKGLPYVEMDARAPLNLYGRSKAEGEDRVLASGACAAILRTSWVFSATGSNFVKTMLRLAAKGEREIGVVADQVGRPTFAPDLAKACLAALAALLDGRSAGVYHVAGDGAATWADLAEATFQEADARGLPSAQVRRITTAEYPTIAARPRDSRLDTGKFAAAFGLRPQPWREAVARCVAQLL